jgi:hypothetical protein
VFAGRTRADEVNKDVHGVFDVQDRGTSDAPHNIEAPQRFQVRQLAPAPHFSPGAPRAANQLHVIANQPLGPPRDYPANVVSADVSVLSEIHGLAYVVKQSCDLHLGVRAPEARAVEYLKAVGESVPFWVMVRVLRNAIKRQK